MWCRFLCPCLQIWPHPGICPCYNFLIGLALLLLMLLESPKIHPERLILVLTTSVHKPLRWASCTSIESLYENDLPARHLRAQKLLASSMILPKIMERDSKIYFNPCSKVSLFESFPRELTQNQLNFLNLHQILDPVWLHQTIAISSSSDISFVMRLRGLYD